MANKQADLKQAGWDARMNNQPCNAPTASEWERGAWEQGWRAANAATPTAVVGREADTRYEDEPEVWFEVQYSRRQANDWYSTTDRYDTVESAWTATGKLRETRARHDFEYRVIRTTVTHAVVPEAGK